MAKFAKKKIKKSVIDKNFADDHCDKWKKNTIPLERGIKEYFIKNQPKWDEKIAEMEKREALKKIKDSIDDDFKDKGDLCYRIFSIHYDKIKDIVPWAVVAIFLLCVLSSFSSVGENNVEIAPPTTTTTLPSSDVITQSSSMFIVFFIVIGFFVIPLVRYRI
jgi:hypothetical protein